MTLVKQKLKKNEFISYKSLYFLKYWFINFKRTIVMNVFKKNPFVSKGKEITLIEIINQYNVYQKEVNKIETEYSTYWLGSASIFIALTLIPFLYIPYIVGSFYIAGFALRFKYNIWVKKIRQSHHEALEHFIFFVQENEKEIMKELYENVKNKQLEEMFDKIITKCANNEYDKNLVFHIDNFLYKSQEQKREVLKEENTNELKKMCKIPLKNRDSYEIPVSVKDKYNEMC